MSADPQDSVFLVTSSDPDNQQFGTAFALYSGEDATGNLIKSPFPAYFLTCRHVVTDVGGPKQVRIGGYQAKVVASGSEGSLEDLAVLRVDGLLHDVSILRLYPSAEIGSRVEILGFRNFAEHFLIRPLGAQLGEK